jgi:class 3 adenylate cyclase
MVVVSRQAAEIAGLDLSGRELHRTAVKGRTEPVQFYALKTLAELTT